MINLTEYINSGGNTTINRFNKTFIAAQLPNTFDVIENLIRSESPEYVLEIGTARGGLTSFINYVGKESNAKFKMISVDIHEQSHYSDIRKEGVDIIIDNIFDWDNNTVINKKILNILTSESKKIIFCDGGNKIGEFNLLSQYLNSNDFILAHDYIENTETFFKSYENIIWNWMEISDADIANVCSKHNLVDHNREQFSNVVWVCKKKL